MPKVGADDFIQHTGATAADLEALPRVDVWPRLDRDALQGLAGDFVNTINPYTEADPRPVTEENVLLREIKLKAPPGGARRSRCSLMRGSPSA